MLGRSAGHVAARDQRVYDRRAFFDVTDGLFTNYSWSAADVSSSVLEAGDRLTDLYIGIDVWGRNFYGGGQFNTQQVGRAGSPASITCGLSCTCDGMHIRTHYCLVNMNKFGDRLDLGKYEVSIP